MTPRALLVSFVLLGSSCAPGAPVVSISVSSDALAGSECELAVLDIEDLENVSFTDLWGGFDELLLQASARYQAETVLVGRIRVEDLPELSRWTWYLGGERELWTGDTEEAIHMLADALAERVRLVTEVFDLVRFHRKP